MLRACIECYNCGGKNVIIQQNGTHIYTRTNTQYTNTTQNMLMRECFEHGVSMHMIPKTFDMNKSKGI